MHALDHVVINTANPDRALALYGARLGLDFRLDRSNPQWGSRLMFFRCGGAVVEIGAGSRPRTRTAPTASPASPGGSPTRTRPRPASPAAGFDVSEVRAGRKPGTKVFTVRSGVVGAPTLMLSADADKRGSLMHPFTDLTAKAAPLDLANVDTDQIIPKQFLKTVEREGLARGLFYDLRFDEEGRPSPASCSTIRATPAPAS